MALLDSILPGVALTALQLIGLAAVLKRLPAGYNPRDGEPLSSDPETWVISASPLLQYKLSQVDGTNIKKGDVKVLVGGSGLGTVIVPDDLILLNGQTVKVVEARPVYSGTEVALYVCQCRK